MGDGHNPVLTADLETVQRRDLHSAESRDFLSWTLYVVEQKQADSTSLTAP